MASKNLLSRIPLWLSRWLGYRSSPPSTPPALIVYFSSFIGAFIGISIIQAIFEQSSYFQSRHVPSIVASYGASAVLCYGSIDVLLAQPRALMGGHFLSALSGLCITKLFRLLPTTARFDSVRWLAGSLSTATAIFVMQITKTTHPPAGATALLFAVDDSIYALGWYYLPVVLLSSTIVLVSALLVNNVQRRYPNFWWEPVTPVLAEEPSRVSADEVEDKSASNGTSVCEV